MEKRADIGPTLAGLDRRRSVLARLAGMALTTDLVFAPGAHGAESRLSDFERQLAVSHGEDFQLLSWHGRSSQQRILFQNAAFLDLIEEPGVICAIVYRGHRGQEADLGAGNTLSSLFLRGLAGNRPSYLASVSPNWRNKPLLPGVAWTGLSDMDVPYSRKEQPRSVSLQFLRRFDDGLQTAQHVLLEHFPCPAGGLAEELSTAIHNAPTHRLLEAVLRLEEEQAAILVWGEAGASTALERMNCQCLEVMSEYPSILTAMQNRHDLALGFGLTSHALDAKHLIAGIVMSIRPRRHMDRLAQWEKGARSLRAILEGAIAGTLGCPANDLVRVRMQQSVHLISRALNSLGLSPARFLAVLHPVVL